MKSKKIPFVIDGISFGEAEIFEDGAVKCTLVDAQVLETSYTTFMITPDSIFEKSKDEK